MYLFILSHVIQRRCIFPLPNLRREHDGPRISDDHGEGAVRGGQQEQNVGGAQQRHQDKERLERPLGLLHPRLRLQTRRPSEFLHKHLQEDLQTSGISDVQECRQISFYSLTMDCAKVKKLLRVNCKPRCAIPQARAWHIPHLLAYKLKDTALFLRL